MECIEEEGSRLMATAELKTLAYACIFFFTVFLIFLVSSTCFIFCLLLFSFPVLMYDCGDIYNLVCWL